MYRNEGFTSLYKGMTPTLLQSAPYGGCQFGFYAIFTNLNEKLGTYAILMQIYRNNLASLCEIRFVGLLITAPQFENQSPVEHLVAGFLAGLCAKAVCYPFDLCRKRLQIQGFQDVRKGFGKVSPTSRLNRSIS